jgi:hypothetical protein
MSNQAQKSIILVRQHNRTRWICVASGFSKNVSMTPKDIKIINPKLKNCLIFDSQEWSIKIWIQSKLISNLLKKIDREKLMFYLIQNKNVALTVIICKN